MRFWLTPLAETLARGEGAMLVHVVDLKGSGPRDVGAQMLVTERESFGSIGGGELENVAMRAARDRLHAGQAGVEHHALGPELNQCCGGSVTLAYEPFAPADHAWLRKLMRTADDPVAIFRTLSIDDAGNLRRDWSAGGAGPDYAVGAGVTSPLRGGRRSQGEAAANFGRGAGTNEEIPPPETGHASLAGFDLPSRGRLRAIDEASALEIRERVNPIPQALYLFGAGHVGKAVARALQPLGFAISWIDGRAGELPDPPLDGVKQLALAMPELIVDEAPPDTVFLVMTHSHPLDETICEAILSRGDFAYLGLIGSETKRARFVKRLAADGIAEKDLARLICPIGLPTIASKEPAAIAASVAADLLIRREKQLLSAKGEALHGRR